MLKKTWVDLYVEYEKCVVSIIKLQLSYRIEGRRILIIFSRRLH